MRKVRKTKMRLPPYITGTIGHKTNSYCDKSQIIVLPGLGPKKVENHWSSVVVLNVGFTVAYQEINASILAAHDSPF